MNESLLEALKKRILIGDGAMGTLLYSYGIDRCFEALNVSDADQILHVHQAYIHAGADVIQTNTYGANAIKLARYGLEGEVRRFNEAAVRIARSAAGAGTWILGTIGGIGGFQKHCSLDEIKRSFQQQADCLLEQGVDGLLLETYYDFDELSEVLKLARNMTDCPVIAHVTMQEPGVLINGMTLAEALHALEELGADLVGTNCRLGPFHMLQALRDVPLPKHAFLSAYPNGGLPDYRDGKLTYKTEPSYFKKYAEAFRDAGVRLLGGCCGTTPVEIEAFRQGIAGLEPLEEKAPGQRPAIQKETEVVVNEADGPETPLYEKALQGRSVFVEFDTPKHLKTEQFFKGVRAIEEAGADAVTMADNSLASPRISNAAVGRLIKERFSIPPLIHLTCRDRNLIGLQSHLMGLDVLGLHDVLIVTGDPTKIGDFPGATSVYDLSSMQLIELVKKFNRGISYSGKSLKQPTHFRVAAAFNPNVRNLDRAVQRLRRKIESGADYFISQPVFDRERILEMKQATDGLSAPIYLGIMPLTSSRNAEFLHNEVPGIQLPDEVRERMAAATTREEARRTGVDIAKELIDVAMGQFRGIYLITPMAHYEMTAELVRYVKDKERLLSDGGAGHPDRLPGTARPGASAMQDRA